jgi:DNA helicase-2/ATP-dependent DNA helicase PcrA
VDFIERYKKLNKNQKKAVDAIEGPVLVVAGPGSGKTEILSLRVGKILQESQILASNVLCLTFTESASVNMRNRLSTLIGSEAYRVAIHTFHNFCVDIIQKYPEFFYSGAFFSPADTLTQTQIMQEIFESLPHNHVLKSEHPDQGFVYLKSVLSTISYLKKAGIFPDEFRNIILHNQKSSKEIDFVLQETFSDRVGKGSIEKVASAVEKILRLAEKSKLDFPSAYFKSLPETISSSLKKACDEALEEDKATPLSKWKQDWMKKNDNGESILKDSVYIDKMFAVADLYEKYKVEMHKRGFYDFDDMILDVISVLEKFPSVRYEIQEQYQYVLVDEFQDTNEAQMRLLKLITDAPVNEGKPNIMAVGDDDQAVYKFQGAELSNILNFKKFFKDVEVVTMTENYRSTQDILDIASHIIRKGEERLEKILPEIKKDLIASNKEIGSGEITHKEFPTLAHEYHFVSREIKKKIDSGERPEEIAVIARKHYQLESLVSYLQGVSVPIKYEREQNVFKEPHIVQLIIIARFVASLADKRNDEADEFLPQILSFPFWKVEREEIWKISLASRRDTSEGAGKNWLEVMLESSERQVNEIAKFLIDLGSRAQYEPLEKILDEIIGAHLPMSPESEDSDTDEENDVFSNNKKTKDFISPFKEFYFSKEKFNHARAEYLTFLSSLRVFINALREYKEGEILSMRDLVDFVDLHEKNDIPLNDQSPFAKLEGAVNFLTAHKAKGLEFKTVFVLSCQDDIWAGRGGGSKLVLPSNLPIEPAGDTEDDQLRLFYVAITRAKRFLYLTSYMTEEGGKEAQKLRFLVAKDGEEEVLKREALKRLYFGNVKMDDETLPEASEVLTASWLRYHTPPFMGSEDKLLKSLLSEYKLSVTHLNNFLNVTKGGPQYFLEQNLLRFPQSKSSSGAYGSAIHYTMEKVSLYLKKESKVPEDKEILDWFVQFLKKERISPDDYKNFKEKGTVDLSVFLKEKKGGLSVKDIVEFNFKDQGVLVGGAVLNGKIDRIVDIGSNEFEVRDYKTGKPKGDWQGKTDYEKTKLYQYERQLLFYKLLVENSREFMGKKKVVRGVLDYIEPKNDEIIDLPMTMSEEKVDRLKNLTSIVYKKIINLDFPDTSKYSQDLKGIVQFEEDLLAGRI